MAVGRRRVAAAALGIALFLAGPAMADNRDDLIALVNGLTSLSATFEQQRYDETGTLLETSSGECQVQRPGRFRWVYRTPFEQHIVSDGEYVWIYDVDLDQVTVNTIGDAPGGSPAALLGNETDVAAHYAIEESDDGDDGLAWFVLRPQAGGGDFARIELGLANGELGAIRLHDNLGQRTLLRFTDVARNDALESGLFDFTPPPGIDVIRGADMP